MAYFRTSGEAGKDPNEDEMEDFDPNDPDATIVHYDLANWTADDQAELAAAFADARVAHAWGAGGELLVPESVEERADAIVDELERKLGVGMGTVVADLSSDVVEYDLEEWPEGDRKAITQAIGDGLMPYRWDGNTLVVSARDEQTVDEILDAVERGDVVGELDDRSQTGDEEEPPAEALTSFFLAGDRLARRADDPDGVRHLLDALEIADPDIAPYGVERTMWRRCCELAEQLADALGDDEVPDLEAAQERAAELRDLLRDQV